MRAARPIAGWLAALSVGLAAGATAQEPTPTVWSWRQAPGPVAVTAQPPAHSATIPQATGTPLHPAAAMLASLGVPGLGQHLLGQRRKWAYLAVEVLGWGFHVDRLRAGADYRDRYRDLAWDAARIQEVPRIDGDFAYYETLTHWSRSGAFDADPGLAGTQPEMDPATYNGSIWARAAGIFLPSGAVPESDPAYQNALEYYAERAYSTEFLWDWTGTGPAPDDFADLIDESDQRFRQATNVLGAILANHVIAATDAYLSARGLSTPLEVAVSPDLGATTGRWSGSVRVSVPW